jgi:oxygen-dependent protoporphyrinogen oxidase
LSLAATMPGLHREAQRHPTLSAAVRAALAASPRPPGEPVFATVTGGLSRLVVATAAAADVRVRHGLPVRGLARTSAGWRLALGAAPRPDHMTADGVVLAVPAAPAGRLLQEVDAETAADVGALDYASVALVTLAFPAGTGLPALSGLLVPAGEGYLVKAATFVTTKWPHLHRPGDPVLVRVSLGRHGEAEVLQRTDEELITLVREELPALIGADLAAPLAAEVTRWGGALPQYGVGHVERVAAARSRLPDTLALAGAALDGVGIAACVRSGEAAADAVWAALEQSNA